MAFFCYDVETLAVESTAVILSAAIVKFDFNIPPEPNLMEEFSELVHSSLCVKLNSRIQIEQYNRTVDKSTLDWWSKQGEFIRNLSFKPSKNDLTPADAIQHLRNYIKDNSDGQRNIIWVRGSLDQMVTDSLCKVVGVDPLAHYSDWRDIRTAVDLLAETSTNGYCDLKYFFDKSIVCKHICAHDVCFDALMLKYPK